MFRSSVFASCRSLPDRVLEVAGPMRPLGTRWLPLGVAIVGAALLSSWAVRPAAAQDTVPRCDASLWHHVYHAYRLQVLKSCVAVTGTIQEIRYEKDGDDHVLIRVDPAYEQLLNAANMTDERGDLVVEPVCEHAVTQADAVASCEGFSSDIAVPPPGTHVRVVGPYVLDQDHGWMEIHPATSVTPLGAAASGPDTSSFAVPADTTAASVRVWVNTHSGVYHCPGTRWYGTTKQGEYLTEAQARSHGYRPAYGTPCSPQAAEPPKSDTASHPAASQATAAPSVTVWVNTNSGVYHCPGSRWYGRTKRGTYMSEADARKHGYRPAYGRTCRGPGG